MGRREWGSGDTVSMTRRSKRGKKLIRSTSPFFVTSVRTKKKRVWGVDQTKKKESQDESFGYIS